MRRAHRSPCLLWLIGLVAVALLAAPGAPRGDEGTACHPALDPDKAQYVIGYGSLMETASKARTWRNTGVSLPVRVRGFERSWTARGTDVGFSTTYLGIAPKAGADMVAALYRVFDMEDFAAGDAREFIYCRVPVEPSHITMLDGSDVPVGGKVWIYALQADSRHPPDARFPIVQSYVDIFLNGCLELAQRVVVDGVDFVSACVTTTHGWSAHWVNDRIHPRRPFGQPNARRIDALLHRMLPAQFQAIRIE